MKRRMYFISNNMFTSSALVIFAFIHLSNATLLTQKKQSALENAIDSTILNNDKLAALMTARQQQQQQQQQPIVPTPNVVSRLGESVLLECGASEHELLRQLESSGPSMPVLVNWFKHFSSTRRSDKPIYAKYLANNIDYAPHVSRDYENRLQIVDKINLNISNLRATDEALYECRLILFDKAYADSHTGSMFYLQVHVAPEFEYPNEELVYYKPNVPIRLYCYAKGKPTPSITWYKNGVRLEANTSVLQETFSSSQDESWPVATSDMFEYKCQVENSVGRIEHTVKVIKSGSLFFTEPLKNITVTEGTILNWPCLAQSNADITYKWFKDSISVQSVLHRWTERGALFQDGMLYLLEAYRNDSGLYECHAYTQNKRIEAKAFLNVLYGPEISTFSSLPIYAFENSESVVLDCIVKSNPAINSLEWFKDKYLLSNTNKYQILPNNSLLIRNMQKADRGQYYCSCNNTIKKTVSALIKLEIVDARKVEITTLYTSSSQTSFKIPCMPLMGIPDVSSVEIGLEDMKWFKLNSKLQPNKFRMEGDGSLNLLNLHISDSGLYYCKVNPEFLHRLATKNSKNQTKTLLQYSMDKVFSNDNTKLVKLNVIQNKGDSSLTDSENYDDKEEVDEKIAEPLPLCPENIKINQTNNGIQLTWTYPKQTPVKIESFQIYFREINNEKTFNQTLSSSLSEWKTSESIDSTQIDYFIDEEHLSQNKLYEFQMVSFSVYSKSLPSNTIKLKYSSTSSSTITSHQVKSIFATPSSNSPIYLRLINISQLDIILIAIFVILVFILILCIVACVAYKRSFKSKSKNSKDIDEWGFHTSSGATNSFLSSTSSSEKSFNMFKNKSQRNSAIDCDLNRQNVNINNNNHYNDIDDVNCKINSNFVKKPNFLLEKCDETDYYYPKTRNQNVKIVENDINKNDTSKSNKHSSGSSSGVASVTSSCSDASDQNCLDDDACPIHTPINTIKYNAKTNILHQQNNNNNTSLKKIHFIQNAKNVTSSQKFYMEGVNCKYETKKFLNIKTNDNQEANLKYSTLQKMNYSQPLQNRNDKFFTLNNRKISFDNSGSEVFIKNGSSSCRIHSKLTNKPALLDSLLETQHASNEVTTADTSCSQNTATTSADSLLLHPHPYTHTHTHHPNNVGDSSGISLNVDTSSESHERSFNKNLTSFNSFKMMNKAAKSPPEILECFNWVNDVAGASTSPLVTSGSETTSSSSSSTYSHVEILPNSTNNNNFSSASSLYSSKISPLPFPTNHFSFVSTEKKCSNCRSNVNDGDEASAINGVAASSISDTTSSASSSSSSTTSSTSGCSSESNSHSMSNQYYLNKPVNETCKFMMPPTVCVDDYSEIQNLICKPPPPTPSQRNSICMPNRDETSAKAPIIAHQQTFSTYKPILKTSISNTSQLKKPSNSNAHSTFRTSKIEFV